MGKKEIQPGNQPATNPEEGRRLTFRERIEEILIRRGRKAPGTPVSHQVLANEAGCSRQRASQVYQETKKKRAETIPPKQPAHRPKGTVNRNNRPIVEALYQRVEDRTKPRKEIAAEVARQLELGPKGSDRVQHQIARMIGTGEFPRRKAVHLIGDERADIRNRVAALVEAGETNAEIAGRLKISTVQVRSLRNEARREGQLPKGKRGKKQKKGR